MFLCHIFYRLRSIINKQVSLVVIFNMLQVGMNGFLSLYSFSHIHYNPELMFLLPGEAVCGNAIYRQYSDFTLQAPGTVCVMSY